MELLTLINLQSIPLDSWGGAGVVPPSGSKNKAIINTIKGGTCLFIYSLIKITLKDRAS
jgi:hypothetical protein